MVRFLSAAAIVIFAATFSSAQEAVEPVSAEARVATERYNRLGVSLFGAVRQARKGNFVVSSWPTHRSLSLAYLGAAGETRKEIGKVVGSEDPIADEVALLAAIDPGMAHWNLLARSTNGGGQQVDQVQWGTLSAVWVDDRVKVRPTYATAVGRMHGTLIRALDFQNSGKAIADVNQWVSQVTENRIPRLLDAAAFNQDTRLALSTATFFKAPWAYRTQFKRENTRFELFQVNGKDSQRVPTMSKRNLFGSAVHEDFTALTLPSAGGFQLLLLVPKEGKSIANLEEGITAELLQKCASLKKSQIELHLPKFQIAAKTLALGPLLQSMGMRLAFEDEKADFSALSTGPSLKIADIFDAAEFRIDEHGLSGAGATVVAPAIFAGDPESLPVDSTFRVDRPFIFALQHAGTGYCVFLGKVVDPR